MVETCQRKRRFPQRPIVVPMALAAGLLSFAGSGHGLGFGPPKATAVIGSPLDFSLPLQVRAGEVFEPGCVQVEVQVGDRRLPPYAVRWQVGRGARADDLRVQVSTLAVLDEPVVTVLVSSGCQSRVNLRTTLLAQLPGPNAQISAQILAQMPTQMPVRVPAQVPAQILAPATGDFPTPVVYRGLATSTVKPLRTATVIRPRQPDGLKLDRLLPAAVAALALPQRLPAGALPAPADVILGVQAALADAAVQTATEQIRSLEQQVQQVLTEARRQQDQLAQLRQRLSAAESANAWLPWLLLGIGVSGMLVAWLGLRLRRLQSELEQRHWTDSADGLRVSSTAEAVETGGQPLLSPDRRLLSTGHGSGPAAAATTPDMTIAQPTMAAAAAAPPARAVRSSTEFSLGTGVPPRPVSVEELIDLDQQVDFFLVLGQEQAAVELLLSHVRSTGGTNALPYFKLLEIYCQQGDEEAYERTRERFNQRFNTFAPAVGGDLLSGRSLEDYPDTVLRLQRAWPQPLRAVAELESLLLRRAALEPFDLPAYRDVLMLHALVRDLPAGALQPATTTAPRPALAPRPVLARPGSPATVGADDGVDLLLPLGDGPLDITVPPSQVSERASAQAMLADWVFTRSTQPRRPVDDNTAALATSAVSRADGQPLVDLDLSDFAPAPREFTRPAAFTDIDQRRGSRLSDLGSFDPDDRLPTVSHR